MSVERNKRTVTRVFEEAFNRGDLRVVDELLAGPGVDHQHPDEPSFNEHLKDVITALRTAFPDLRFEITQMIGEGDWVALHSVMTGVHRSELRRPVLPADGPPLVPPTGRPIRVPHMYLIRLGEGQSSELWHVMDTLTMLGQPGLLPARTPAQAQP